MRLIILLLLLANVAFFAWHYLVPAEVVPSVSAPAMVGAPMLLWSERQARQRGEVAADGGTSAASPVSGPRPVAEACYTVGPFSIVSDVSRAATFFDGEEITAQQRAAAARRRAGFWVYIPPQGSLQAARDVLRYLQSKGVEDALIIAEGKKENSISVGVFSNPDKAERRREVISALGYPVEVEPLYRTQPQYWLDLELWTESRIPAATWARLERAFPNVKVERRACHR